MEHVANVLNSLVPITLFNKGQASRIFDRLRTEPQLIVLKNNQPSAVILSPDEYSRLAEIEEEYLLLTEAQERLSANEGKKGLSQDEILEHLGLTQEDIDNAEDVEIE